MPLNRQKQREEQAQRREAEERAQREAIREEHSAKLEEKQNVRLASQT